MGNKYPRAVWAPGRLRPRAGRQAWRIESGPNHPELKANDLAAIDAKLEPLRLKASAATMGVYFYDPRDMSGGDKDHQRWVAMARERGMLVNPSNFGESLHAAKEQEGSPLKVIRGGNGAGPGIADDGASMR